jgi:hypothetical protein
VRVHVELDGVAIGVAHDQRLAHTEVERGLDGDPLRLELHLGRGQLAHVIADLEREVVEPDRLAVLQALVTVSRDDRSSQVAAR